MGMNRVADRETTIMIYRDADALIQRGPYAILE
jgi:hypothetical protein